MEDLEEERERKRRRNANNNSRVSGKKRKATNLPKHFEPKNKYIRSVSEITVRDIRRRDLPNLSVTELIVTFDRPVEDAYEIVTLAIDTLIDNDIIEPMGIILRLVTEKGEYFVLRLYEFDPNEEQAEQKFRVFVQERIDSWSGAGRAAYKSGEFSPIVRMEIVVYRHTAGGCTKSKVVSRSETNGMIMASYYSTRNTCLMACICQFLGKKNTNYGESNRFNDWCGEAYEMIFPVGQTISYYHIGKFAEYYNIRIIVYDLDCNVLQDSIGESESTMSDNEEEEDEEGNIITNKKLELVFNEGHYYRLMNKKAAQQKYQCDRCRKWSVKRHDPCRYQKCAACGTWWLRRHPKCDASKVSFRSKEQRAEQKHYKVTSLEIFKEAPLDQKNIVIFDFETFADKETQQQFVYACGWMYKGDETPTFKYTYGDRALSEFFDAMVKLSETNNKKLTLVGFNIANFDSHFLISEMLSRDIVPKFVIDNKSLIQLKCKYFKCFDLMKFLPGSSLASACTNFKAPPEYTKGYFPHLFPQCYRDVFYIGNAPGREFYDRKHAPPADWEFPEEWDFQKTCIGYLEFDILATNFVFEKVNDVFYDRLKVHVTEFVTLSQLGYEFWANLVASNRYGKVVKPDHIPCGKKEYFIEVPDKEKLAFEKRAIYGGRVFPVRRSYKSEQYDDIVTGKVPFSEINDYVAYKDAVSLYPKSMHMGVFPIGRSHWVDDCKVHEDWIKQKEYHNLPIGFYSVTYVPNKKLIIPGLPRKDYKDGIAQPGIIWDLQDGEGVYTNIDIMIARELGYEFKVHKALVFDDSEYLFKDFIEICFKIKQDGEETGNAALRQIGKILQNSVYGKMLMHPKDEKEHIIKTRDALENFREKHDILDIILIENNLNTVILKGRLKDVTSAISKSTQNGAFILSYSRLVMEEYARLSDPHRMYDISESAENSWFYGDTDSLFLRINSERKRNMFKGKETPNVLGHFVNELKDDGKIIEGYWLLPKTYCYTYINNKGEIKTVCKSKGVDSDYYKKEDYIKLMETNLPSEDREIRSIKKVGLNHAILKNKEKEPLERKPFEVVTQYIKRNLANSLWNGRNFVDNTSCSYPHGFVQ